MLPRRAKTSESLVCILLIVNIVACANVGTSALGSGSVDNQDAAMVLSGASGSTCTANAATGVTLCLGTTACPNVTVDSVQFPNCGFYTYVPDFDLECVCLGNYLCPVGVVSSCDQVSALFSNNTLADICNKVSLGYCTQGTRSSTQGGTSSTCDQTCYATCVGAPACIVACGC